MKKAYLKNTYNLIISQLQTIIAICYIIIIGVGMLFNYQKYSEYNINIFYYSDIFDFLIAPFSDIYILIFSILSLTIVSALIQLDNFWKKRWPTSYSIANFKLDKKRFFKLYRAIIFTIGFILYLYLAADTYGKLSKENTLSKDPIKISFSDNSYRKGKLIGKTKDVIFLLVNDTVIAIPISSSVKEIQIK